MYAKTVPNHEKTPNSLLFNELGAYWLNIRICGNCSKMEQSELKLRQKKEIKVFDYNVLCENVSFW